MGAVAFGAYLAAESYGRSHEDLAFLNASFVRATGEFSLPHVFGEQAIYWGSEFVVLPLMAIILFVIGRDDVLWSEWVAFFTSSMIGCLVYILFPVAPPWAYGPNVVALGDPFGAMPSLHMADAVIVAVCLGRIIRGNFGYLLGWSYVVAVAYSVISTRNHYPLDVVAGVFLGIFCMVWRRNEGLSTVTA